MGICENIQIVKNNIKVCAESVNRRVEDVTLIAVSKTKPISDVEEAIKAGQTVFGENKPQELKIKYEAHPEVHWHLIGHLQRNKVKDVVGRAELIHSVDSIALADEIEKCAGKLGIVQNILLQVNVTGEDSKFGIHPDEIQKVCEYISGLAHLKISGLMTISMKGMTEEENKAVFTTLKRIALEIEGLALPGVSMNELSMGMTHDMKEAVQCGATMVRVGTAIFGERIYNLK